MSDCEDDSSCDDDEASIIGLWARAFKDVDHKLTTMGHDAKDRHHTDDHATSKSSRPRKDDRRQHRKSKCKSQHSLDNLRHHISHLMSIFETNGWFIPIPTSPHSGEPHEDRHRHTRGKVWSNRNYGADKKRQRKQSERQLLEVRIEQLEHFLRDEHGMADLRQL
jgi:hypothetical protein